MDLTAMGRVGLIGWRGRLTERIAEPVSERTRYSKEQIEALIGGIFLALTFWQFVRLFRRVWQAGKGESLAPA
jgi:hypothetical protein